MATAIPAYQETHDAGSSGGSCRILCYARVLHQTQSQRGLRRGLERDCEVCPLDWFVRVHRRNPASTVMSIQRISTSILARCSRCSLTVWRLHGTATILDVLAQARELHYLSRLATSPPLRCSDVCSDSCLTLKMGLSNRVGAGAEPVRLIPRCHLPSCHSFFELQASKLHCPPFLFGHLLSWAVASSASCWVLLRLIKLHTVGGDSLLSPSFSIAHSR